jgi:glycerophosphoryl diester phosphodiesterase
VWTPDSRSEMKRLIDMGVDGIITNRPDILKVVLKEP